MTDKLQEEDFDKTTDTSADTPLEKPEDTPAKKGISDDQANKIAEVMATDPKSLTATEMENFIGWKKRKTEEMLDNEPKVRIYIPFSTGEDKNNQANKYADFRINGVAIKVRKGMYVEVPLSVANLHMQSVADTDAAYDQEHAMSNIGRKYDPVTGQNKSIDRLV